MNVFTLAIGDHVHGFVALCNSLCAAGFDGRIHVGYHSEIGCEIAAGAPIVLHELPEDILQPMNRKATFLLDHATGTFLYLDADIVVMNRAILEALSDAVATGPVFCAEAIIPERDIRRAVWRRAKRSNLEEYSDVGARDVQSTNMYYNAGLVCGNMRRDRRLVFDWNRMIRRTLPANADGLFEVPYFPMPDQDCLNALLQDEKSAFSCIGPPDVWYATSAASPFSHVGSFEAALLHGTGPKPWRHKSVPARDPNRYEVAWYRFSHQETPWVRSRLELTKPVLHWLRNSRRGRAISKAKRLRARFVFW
jgi:lipopolysaccharide biosynthesis glycosyltransferase